MSDPLVKVRDLSKSFDGKLRILDEVGLDLGSGESLALTGESGSGKSTFMHILAGLEPADSGLVEVSGRDITNLSDPAKAKFRLETIGLIFQQFNLIPSLDVKANIAFQARLADRYDPAFCTEIAEKLGLSEHMSKYPEELSGGQQQRVAVARALAVRPLLLLADEPTGNLDEVSSEAVISALFELAHEGRSGLLLVTHSTDLANRADRQIALRQGRFST